MNDPQHYPVLLSSLCEGNHDAFRQLYDLYWERLYVMAYNRLQDMGDAEDIVQQIFINLWKNRQQLNGIRSLEAYLACAVRHMVYNIIRHRSVKKQYIENYLRRADIFDRLTEDRLSFNELYHQMQALVADLPPQCKLIFSMSRMDGYSNREIADKTGLSVRTVEHHINRALKILRGGLGDLLFIEISAFFLTQH